MALGCAILLTGSGCKKTSDAVPTVHPIDSTSNTTVHPIDSTSNRRVLLKTYRYYGYSSGCCYGSGSAFAQNDSVVVQEYSGDSVVLNTINPEFTTKRFSWTLDAGDSSSTYSPNRIINEIWKSHDSLMLLGNWRGNPGVK